MLDKFFKIIAEAWSRIYPSNELMTAKIRSIAKRVEAKTGENPLADLTDGTFDGGGVILAIGRLRDAYDCIDKADPSLEGMIREVEEQYADELADLQP